MNLDLSSDLYTRSVSFPSDYLSPGDGAPGPMGRLSGIAKPTEGFYVNGRDVELKTNNSVNMTQRVGWENDFSPSTIFDNIDLMSVYFKTTSQSAIVRYSSDPRSLMNDLPAGVMSVGATN